MQYLLLVYTDPALMAALPQDQYDAHMRDCLHHADELTACGKLLGFQQLQPVEQARTVRLRESGLRVVDGPFAETKELLAGFEAASLDEAVEMAKEFPWIRYGSIEVRPVRDVGAVRVRVGA